MNILVTLILFGLNSISEAQEAPVQEFNEVSANDLDNGMDISNLSTGTYIAYFKMGSVTKTKKILIE